MFAARIVVPVWILFATEELGPRGRVNLSPERGILLYRALGGVGLPRFLSCLFEDVPYSYRSSVTSFPWSIFDKWNLSVNCLVVRTEFCYDKFTAVLSFIAKDVVAEGLNHDTFVLPIRSSRLESSLKGMREIKPKKLDTERVRGQLRGDFLLGRDRAE
ncbi:hypothetical protein F2Q70_00026540 [Brassica cretica]|uniref:Uncharacterized protein n=1 Tax=Brassica cretica TaxID=69181 RepID=A0A8S9IDL2_BRACR|nr:hypothetical protein F2Q68_00026113 [Brassica cretica]KAF2601157.1 hypothetical protein F2Q70_00026540 [Brassica cretica]